MEQSNILYLDLESTSLKTYQARICEIGIIFGDYKKRILINPEVEIPEVCTKIHGITNEMVKAAPTFKQIAPNLLNLIMKADYIGGYNVRNYDYALLHTEFLRCGIEMPEKPIIDVYEIASELLKSKKLKDVFRILTGHELKNAHSAMADIEATKLIHEIIIKKFLS